MAGRLGSRRAMVLGLAGWSIGYALLGFAHGAGALSVTILVAQQVIGDSTGTVYYITHLTTVQKTAPPAMLGRVIAGIRFFQLAAAIARAGLAASLASAIGLRYAITTGAALLLISAAIVFGALIDSENEAF